MQRLRLPSDWGRANALATIIPDSAERYLSKNIFQD